MVQDAVGVCSHIGVVLLQQLSQGLQEGHQELPGFTQHPARLGDEDTQEDSAHGELALPRPVRHREVVW